MRWRTALWAAGGAVLGSAGMLTGSASAQLPAPAPGSAPVTYSAPASNDTVRVANLTISAHVLLADTGHEIRLKVECVADCDGATVDQAVAPKDEVCQRVDFRVSLPRNGRYRATISAPVRAGLPPTATGECNPGGDPPREFFLAAPPVTPTGLRAVPAPDGAASVSWNRNPEPDMIGYLVQRARASGPFEQVGDPRETSFRDASANQGPAPRYRVIAVRRGPHGPVASEPSTAVTVGAAGGITRGGRGAPTKPAQLSKFGRLLEQAKAAAEAGGGAETGFDPNLPYGDEAELGQGEEELGANERGGDLRRTMSFLAGGLLTLAVALHVWWLKREAEKEPLEALPPSALPEIREPLPG